MTSLHFQTSLDIPKVTGRQLNASCGEHCCGMTWRRFVGTSSAHGQRFISTGKNFSLDHLSKGFFTVHQLSKVMNKPSGARTSLESFHASKPAFREHVEVPKDINGAVPHWSCCQEQMSPSRKWNYSWIRISAIRLAVIAPGILLENLSDLLFALLTLSKRSSILSIA